MYCSPNFKTKKALKDAIEAGQTVTVFQPNNFFGVVVPENGKVVLEGPHYPQPHKWYGTATLENGKVIKIS